jgi:hypothetical protein
MRKKASFCVNKYLKEPCKQTNLRAIKTVRGTMDETEQLLEKDPNFKVIQLLRDPRGVTRSRLKAAWSRGFYDSHKEDRVAHVYCSTALEDYRTSQRLRKKYPDRIMNMTLEEFVKRPEAKLRELQDFLGLQLGPDTLHNIYKRMRRGFANKWRSDMSSHVVSSINQECGEFMNALNITI